MHRHTHTCYAVSKVISQQSFKKKLHDVCACVSACCSVVQCVAVAVCCITMQLHCRNMCCSLSHVTQCRKSSFITPDHAAAYCNTLQLQHTATATHCNTLQHELTHTHTSHSVESQSHHTGPRRRQKKGGRPPVEFSRHLQKNQKTKGSRSPAEGRNCVCALRGSCQGKNRKKDK